MYVIVYLNGNTNAIALSDAEATGKNNVIFEVVFLDCILQKFYDRGRTLDVAGGTDTNLNKQHGLYLCQNFVGKKFVNCFGRYGMEYAVNCYANALLALTQAECASEIYLVAKIVVGDQLLKLFYYLTGSFDVAATTDAYNDFHVFSSQSFI